MSLRSIESTYLLFTNKTPDPHHPAPEYEDLADQLSPERNTMTTTVPSPTTRLPELRAFLHIAG